MKYMQSKGAVLKPAGENTYTMTASSQDISVYRSLPGVRAIIERDDAAITVSLAGDTPADILGGHHPVSIGGDIICTVRRECIGISMVVAFILGLFATIITVISVAVNRCGAPEH